MIERKNLARWLCAALVLGSAAAAGAEEKVEEAAAVESGWVKSLGGPNRDFALDVAAGSGGAVYALGHFHGDTRIGGQTLTSAGDSDVFVARLDARGEVEWARRLGGRGQDEGRGLAAAPGGGVWVTGFFSHEADLGAGSSLRLVSAGSSDAFLVHLGDDGRPLRALRFGGARGDVGFGVTAGPAGSVYLAGYFQGEVDFDPGPGETKLASAGSSDAFALRLGEGGELLWARRLGGARRDEARALAVADDGRAAVVGNFEDRIGEELASAGRADVFLWRLGPEGERLGLAGFGGPGPDSGEAVAAAPGGDVYAAGSFAATVELGAATLTARGATDAYAARFLADGRPRWARALGGEGSDFAFGVALAGDRVVAAGFSQLPVGEARSSGESLAFVEWLDAAGESAGRRTLRSSSGVQALGLALNGETPCVAGMFRGAIEVELGAGAIEVPGAGKFDVFVACLPSPG